MLTLDAVLDPLLNCVDEADVRRVLCGSARKLLRVVPLLLRYPPDEAQGRDDGGGGQDHGQEAHEGEDVLPPRDGVGEQQDGRYGVVEAPDDGDEQRAHDDRAREHLGQALAQIRMRVETGKIAEVWQDSCTAVHRAVK